MTRFIFSFHSKILYWSLPGPRVTWKSICIVKDEAVRSKAGDRCACFPTNQSAWTKFSLRKMQTQQDHKYTQNEGNQRANIAFMEGWERPAGACATAEWGLIFVFSISLRWLRFEQLVCTNLRARVFWKLMTSLKFTKLNILIKSYYLC